MAEKKEKKAINEKEKSTSNNYERLHELAGKTKLELEKLLRVIGKEANLSSQFVKGKMDIISINTELGKLYRELGKEAYNLIIDGKIKEPGLNSIRLKVDELYKKLDENKQNLEKLKGQMKKAGSEK